MRGASFPPGGVRGSVPRRWRNERGWTALSNPQRSWIFRNRHGLLGKRLLHHHRCLDIVLHIQHDLQPWKWTTLGILRERK